MPAPSSHETLSTGEFARRSRLSAKALRIYDQIGLLRPAEMDPSNGYRRYRREQLATARLIAMLRGVDMSLAEIGDLLAALTHGHEIASQRLNAHLSELENRHTSRRSLVRHIHAILREEECPMFLVQTRHVPARRVMSIQRRLRAFETDSFVREVKLLFAEHLDGVSATGPFSLIFHGIVDQDGDGPLEATLACPDRVELTELIGIRTEPEHDEAFATITNKEWAYPAILAAYDAVACSPEAAARPGSRLSCREVYLAEPDAISDDDLICDVAFPLGEPSLKG